MSHDKTFNNLFSFVPPVIITHSFLLPIFYFFSHFTSSSFISTDTFDPFLINTSQFLDVPKRPFSLFHSPLSSNPPFPQSFQKCNTYIKVYPQCAPNSTERVYEVIGKPQDIALAVLSITELLYPVCFRSFSRWSIFSKCDL